MVFSFTKFSIKVRLRFVRIIHSILTVPYVLPRYLVEIYLQYSHMYVRQLYILNVFDNIII